MVDAARLMSFAQGRGGVPSAQEWPFVILALALFALIVGRLLVTFGLTKLEAGIVAGVAPFTVLIDVPMGLMDGGVALAANVAGALIPFAICVKVLAERRVPAGALLLVMAVGTLAAYLSSEVVPSRGVLLHYRMPSIVVGVLAGVLWHRQGIAAGAGAYAAGAAGVILGADFVRLTELAAAGNAARIVVGGAGLFDGIYLVAFLAAGVGASTAVLLRWITGLTAPSRPAAG